ncbi:MAG: discoidin domain-containing protein [Bacteroidaceae bacterium]|nr:discoidin domain-containing protein [Bacteroidaceae bacterium]
MRKLRLLFASMLALLAWTGAMAQTEAEADAANAVLRDGKRYTISTTDDGTKYYLTTEGYLVTDFEEAGIFTFKKCQASGTFLPIGWQCTDVFWSNPARTTDESGKFVAVNDGRIRYDKGNGGRQDWEAQVYYLQGGKYAIRTTNATNTDWLCDYFWTVDYDENDDLVGWYVRPQEDDSYDIFIWEVEEYVDPRMPLYDKVVTWLPRLQAATGYIQDAAQFSCNAKEESEGSYEALIDGDYSSFFHSSWSAAGPDEDHYLQVELTEAVDKFVLYFKKRSQNNNNRPTIINILGSNDGTNFEELDAIEEGLPTDASVLDYSAAIELDAPYKFIRFSIAATNNGATHAESTHPFFTFSEFYLLPDNEMTNTVMEYTQNVKSYTDIDVAEDTEAINAIEALFEAAELPVFYNNALAAIEDGASYRIFANVNGVKYYLTKDGVVTTDDKKASTFTFNKVAGVAYEYGFVLDNGGANCFSNPLNTNEESLYLGSINNNGTKRADWDAQVFFLNNAGKYAVRSTNAAPATSGWGWVGSAYWTVEEVEGETVAQYSWDPQYLFELEGFVDPRAEEFEKIKDLPIKMQEMTGIVENASQYISNAKDPSEGSYEALLDGDYATFFHSTWHASNDPEEDHYLQAEIPAGVKSFYIYYKKRSQNNNNRPTSILISASNNGKDFEEIDAIEEGLPVDASVISYTSDLIDLGSKYKYVRFTIPETNNGAKTGDHVFFTFSEFYLLPDTKLVQEALPFLAVQDYTDLGFDDGAKIDALLEKIAALYKEVTYKVIYNDQVIATATKQDVIGKTPSLPAELNNPFFAYVLDKDVITENTDLVYATASWAGPFEFSTPEEIANLGGKWYNMTIRGNYWVGVDATEPYYPNADKNLDSNFNQWAFVGDAEHISIYNRAYGNTATLAVDGDNVVMREGEPYFWEIFSQADGFVLREPGTDTRYVNQNGGASGPLQFWNSGNGRTDNGSTFRVSAVEETEIAEGEYFFLNLGSGLYLGAGNSWGTQASLRAHGEAQTLIPNGDGTYKLFSQVCNSGADHVYQYFGVNGYMDCHPNDADPLTFIKYGPQYLIKAGSNGFLGFDGESTILGKNLEGYNDPNLQWVLVTKEQLTETLAYATEENPVDATFLFLDANFGRNNVNQSAWVVEDCWNANLTGGNSNRHTGESWRSSFNIYQTAEVPDGHYRVSLQAAVQDYAGLFDGADYPVVYAQDASVPFNSMEGDDLGSSMAKLCDSFEAGKYYVTPLDVVVLDGKLTIGVRGTRTDTWAIWDNFEIYRTGDATAEDYNDALQRLIASGMAYYYAEMSVSAKEELQDALVQSFGVDPTNIESIKAAIARQSAANDRARTSARSFQILENGFVDDALENWSSTNGSAPVLNTWSVEGDTDGSGMVVPFVQTSVAPNATLGNGKMQYTLKGIDPGTYQVTALVRIYRENGTEVSGAKVYTNSHEDDLADATAGIYNEVSAYIWKEVTLTAQVGEDETLVFGVESTNPTYNWIAVKNIVITRPMYVINMLTGSFDTSYVNGKLAKEWYAEEVPGSIDFELTSKFYTMTSEELNGGWPTYQFEYPYIGFYTDGENGEYTVTAPEGYNIAQLIFVGEALTDGGYVIAPKGGQPVWVAGGMQGVVLNYHGVESATFVLDTANEYEYAWVKGQIIVVYNITGEGNELPDVTKVETIKNVNAAGTIFNIAGQRVNKAQKGVYIIDGKKVIK